MIKMRVVILQVLVNLNSDNHLLMKKLERKSNEIKKSGKLPKK